MFFLVGTYRRKNSEGIYLGNINKKDISAKVLYLASQPSYIDWYQKYIFSISKFGIEIFFDGKQIFKDSNQIKAPSHITYDEKFNFIYTANYSTGDLIKYSFNGSDTKIVEIINFGLNSHPHQTYIDYENELIYVPLLGKDEIRVYNHSNLSFELVKIINLEKGFGPRHVVKYKDNIYVAGELGRKVAQINRWQHVVNYTKSYTNGLEEGFSAIRIHPNKPVLYVSNREDNSLIVFKINPDGTLTENQVYMTNYSHCRDFNITHDGNYLISAFLRSDKVVLYKLNSDGHISEELSSCDVFEPTSISFQRFK